MTTLTREFVWYNASLNKIFTCDTAADSYLTSLWPESEIYIRLGEL